MRYWKNAKEDDGSIHSLGNGKLAVYEQGPDIVQVFGPPYSSPSFMKLRLCEIDGSFVTSEREQGTAIWNHIVMKNGNHLGEMTDFVDCKIPCLVRKIKLMQPVKFDLIVEDKWEILDNTLHFNDYDIKLGLVAYAHAGISVYQYASYPSPIGLSHQILGKGNIKIIFSQIRNCWEMECEAGESTLYFVGGPEYPECIKNSEEVLESSYDVLLERTREWWKVFSGRRVDFSTLIPENFPQRDILITTIDNIAVQIQVQQSAEGGVLAGHNYHLGYVRDQYGVSRCLLKLGYFEEAKAILGFYWNIWKRYGVIHNAQALGVDGIFHIHENDDVEITGYLIIQAFDYYKKSWDGEFLREILPMLEWAWNAQKKHLVKFMIPFNGDETYIAGGVLPRSTINDGSAESTLLFITAGEKLLSWVGKHKLWDDQILAENKEILKLTKNSYYENYLKDNKVLTNNPKRTTGMQLPRFRHGVCEGCYNFGWTEINPYYRYVCSNCIVRDDIQSSEKVHYFLQSVSLMPLYIGSLLISKVELTQMLEEIIQQYKETGRLPSRPESNTTVGYDYGLLLYNLTELEHPLCEEIFKKMLSVLDATGAWVEYYEDGKPKGTRCRPWESGINLEAAIHFALNFK